MRPLSTSLALILSLLVTWASASADDRVYQTPEQFLGEAFGTHAPKQAVLWLTRPLQADLNTILGHPPSQLRQRYWTDGQKTAWILEEIGKEEPITAGFVVGPDGRIQMSRVLIYREPRGMEVRYPAFLKQFTGAGLAPNRFLDRNIDGISGATLSVRAMQKMARAALFMNRQARKP
ncbi:FMN-binding protein [Thermithiobacillus plumbiphilus]|uniref:FMN-binding protein n=1 Tax=Thermithiobacillus plumbiphilus TaxID=1729899 RepID=A0ABU9D7V0_9PROT